LLRTRKSRVFVIRDNGVLITDALLPTSATLRCVAMRSNLVPAAAQVDRAMEFFEKEKNVKPRRLLSTSLLFKHAQDPGEIPWDQWYTLLRQSQVVRQRCSLMSIKTWRFFSQRINSIPSLDRCKQVSHLVNREKISRALATVFTWFHY